MREREPQRMQEQPLQALPRETPVQLEVAVLVVARDRKTEMREMHADLMRAAGLELRFEKAPSGKGPLEPEEGQRRLPFGVHAHAPLPGALYVFVQGELHGLFTVLPAA